MSKRPLQDDWRDESTVPPDPVAAEDLHADATLDFQQEGGNGSHNGDPGSSLQTLKSFGDYEILERIAHGGMGVVFRARHRRLNRMVALKMIRSGQFATSSDRARFNLEAEAAAKLDHPGITPIYEIGDHEGQPFFAMKFVEGGSLEDRLQEYVDDPHKAARMVADIANAVHHAHQRGTLHRDLKPNNILIGENGDPLITDFGLAKISDHESGVTQTGAIMGTPGYMSPEQAASSKSVTAAADIYSLGAILFATLTGRPPFEAASAMEVILQVVNKDAPKPSSLAPDVPIELELICLKCLSRDPDDRYTSAAELARDLERWLLGDPVSVRPPSFSGLAWRWFRENLSKAITTALLGVGIAIVWGIFAVVGQHWEQSWIHKVMPSEQTPWVAKILSDFSQFVENTSSFILVPLLVVTIGFLGVAPCLLGALTIRLTKPKSWAETTTFGMFAAMAFAATAFLASGWVPLSDRMVGNVTSDLALLARQEEPMARAQLIWKYPDLHDHAQPFDILRQKVSEDFKLNAAKELPRVGLLYFSAMLLVLVTTSAAYRIREYKSAIVRLLRFIEICLPSLLLFVFFMMLFSAGIYGELATHSTREYFFLFLWIFFVASWFLAAFQNWRWYTRILLPIAFVAAAFGNRYTDPDDRFKKAYQYVSNEDFASAASLFVERAKSRDVPNAEEVTFAMGLHARAGDLPGYSATSAWIMPALKEITPRRAIRALEASQLLPYGAVNKDLTERLAEFAERFPPEADDMGSPKFVAALHAFRRGENERALKLLEDSDRSHFFDAEKSLALESMVHRQMGNDWKAFQKYLALDQAMATVAKRLENKDMVDKEDTYRRWNHHFSLLFVYRQQAAMLLRGGVATDDWKLAFLDRKIEAFGQSEDADSLLNLAQAKLIRLDMTSADATSEQFREVGDLAIQSFEKQPSEAMAEVIVDAVAGYYSQSPLENEPPKRVSDWLEQLEAIAVDLEPERLQFVVYDVMRRLGSVAHNSGRHDLAAKWNKRYAAYLRTLPEDIDTGDRARATWWLSRGQDVAIDENDSLRYLIRQSLYWEADEHIAAGEIEAGLDVYADLWKEYPQKLPVHGCYVQALAKHDPVLVKQFIDSLKTTDAASWRRNRFLQRSYLHFTQGEAESIAKPWRQLATQHLREHGFSEQRTASLTSSQHWRWLKKSIAPHRKQVLDKRMATMDWPPPSPFLVKGVDEYEFFPSKAKPQGTVSNYSSTSSPRNLQYAIAAVESNSEQNCQMVVGNDRSATVWLNGDVVHNAPERKSFVPRGGQTTVELKAGRNVILVRLDRSGLFQLDLEDEDGWPIDAEWLE